MFDWCAMRRDPRARAVEGRREALRRIGLFAALAGFGVGVGTTRSVEAAALQGFDATSMATFLKALGSTPIESTAIEFDMPDVAENGAVVPVTVASRLPRTDRIALIVESNPFPLVARFDFEPGTEPFLATRVKLAQTGTAHALVQADGRLYWTSRDTRVVMGGCGA